MTATRLLRCSPSSLAKYTECPRAYWWAYVARPRPPKPPLTAYRAIGVSVHNAAAAMYDHPAEDIGELAGRHWIAEPFTDPARSRRWYDRAVRWLRTYTAGIDRHAQPRGVERTVSTTTDTLTISGRADRIDQRDGRLVVVDYKSGHRPPEAGEARGSFAFALYAIAAGRMFNTSCRDVELHHLPTGTVQTATHDRESFTRHLARAEDTGGDIQAAVDTLEAGADRDDVFPAQPSPLCSYCDWRAHCPEGQAHPGADPEVLLDRWETTA